MTPVALHPGVGTVLAAADHTSRSGCSEYSCSPCSSASK